MEKETKRELPGAFVEKMEKLLGSDAETFFKSYDAERKFGLRVNPLKLENGEILDPESPLGVYLQGLPKVPWAKEGFYYEAEMRPGRHPFHEAGAYYIQEPSAMSVAEALAPGPGERILDLCAAPGGKSTHLAGKMGRKGLLVCNEIHPARAKILSQNIERLGVGNAVVTNMDPFQLAPAFPEFFDGIVVDAPCSGEGMFRKEEALARDWTPEKSQELATIQRELILQAADMLRPDGLMLYSTCTFAPAEDEQTVSHLLENRPDMELAEMEDYEGFSHGVPEWGNKNPELIKCIRIFPHKMNGEGHFLALFRKKGQAIKESSRPHTKPDKNAFPLIAEFLNEIGLKTLCGQPFDWERVEIRGDKAYYLPPVAHNFRGITFLRNGLYLGDLKKNRFEPSQPLALAIRKDEAEAVISLSASDERITRYLKGETLNIEPEEAAHKKGWHLLCADGYPIGFGKLVNQILKNKYPAGWRV